MKLLLPIIALLFLATTASAQPAAQFRKIDLLCMSFAYPGNWDMSPGDTIAFIGSQLILKGKGVEDGTTPVGDGGHTYIITEVGPSTVKKRDVWKMGDKRPVFDEVNNLFLLDDYKTHHVHYFILKKLVR